VLTTAGVNMVKEFKELEDK